MDVWSPFELASDQFLKVQVGPLRLYVQRVRDEWHIASESLDREEESRRRTVKAVLVTGAMPSHLEPERWIATNGNPRLRLVPQLPDLPVVVRPETTIHLPPGAEARFYLKVPLWLGVILGDDQSRPHLELPVVPLSKTWFGTVTSGELCYSLTTRARRELEVEESRPYRVNCPTLARNESDESLIFERICIRAPHLSVYGGKGRLWSNDVRITFGGILQGSTVDYGSGPPRADRGALLLGPAREKPGHGLRLRSFLPHGTLGDVLGLQGAP